MRLSDCKKYSSGRIVRFDTKSTMIDRLVAIGINFGAEFCVIDNKSGIYQIGSQVVGLHQSIARHILVVLG